MKGCLLETAAGLGNLLHTASDSLPGTNLPDLYHRTGRHTNGCGLFDDPRRVTTLYERRDHYSRCIFRLRPYSTAVCHQYYIYLRADSSGDAADHNVTRLKRYLVEYNHFQHFQRDFTADLVFVLFKERNEKILIYFNDARGKSLNSRCACT